MTQYLLAFAPFLAFALVSQTVGILSALIAGASAALVLLLRDRMSGEQAINVLEAGTAVLFAALALCAWRMPGVVWSIGLVRLCVDVGLMLIVLAGVSIKRPFTLRYARAKVSPEAARSERFMKVCQVVASAWALAFGVLALADVLLVLRPDLPVGIAAVIGIAALLLAAKFTTWYPSR